MAFCFQLALPTCYALNFRSVPVFAPSTNAPLAGLLEVVSDTDSRVSVSVVDGNSQWERHFFDYGTRHLVPLYGFKPGRTNEITVTIHDRRRVAVSTESPVLFVTAPIPDNFPNLQLVSADKSRMEPGYSVFLIDVFGAASQGYGTIVDSDGQVVWYASPPSAFYIRPLPNGNLLMPMITNFVEWDLLGRTVQSWTAPVLPINLHEVVETAHGTLMYLTDALELVNNLPSSQWDPTATPGPAEVLYQNIVEFSLTNSAALTTWSPIQVLDPARISYLFNTATDGLPDPGWDTEHSNAVIEDPSDDSLIVSMRNQNAVIKIARSTGKLIWILGPPENWGPQWQPYLLKPVGSPFAWQYAQHAPVLTPQGTLMIYDDGNYRGSPFGDYVLDSSNFSRAVEYRIDSAAMQVSQVWQYGSTIRGQWFYTGFEGNAEPEPKTGNVLINFAAVSFADGNRIGVASQNNVMARFQEVTHESTPQVVFDLAISNFEKANSDFPNCTVYRVHRIPDLYSHPAAAVEDLQVDLSNGIPRLQFSADDTHHYLIESSDDLTTWQPLGAASESEQKNGEFDFNDIQFVPTPNRFYRVLTL